jgi:hypothetical protein
MGEQSKLRLYTAQIRNPVNSIFPPSLLTVHGFHTPSLWKQLRSLLFHGLIASRIFRRKMEEIHGGDSLAKASRSMAPRLRIGKTINSDKRSVTIRSGYKEANRYFGINRSSVSVVRSVGVVKRPPMVS